MANLKAFLFSLITYAGSPLEKNITIDILEAHKIFLTCLADKLLWSGFKFPCKNVWDLPTIVWESKVSPAHCKQGCPTGS